MAEDKVFVAGLFVGKRTFEWGSITTLDFKTEEFKKFLDEHTNEKGYCKVDVRTARDGEKMYAELNKYVPKSEETSAPPAKSTPKKEVKDVPPAPEPEDDDLPF